MSLDGRRPLIAVCALAAAGVSAAAAVVAFRRALKLSKRRRNSYSDDVRQGDGKGFAWAEIAEHHSLDSIWTVLRGEVFDVTPFLDEHPGGKLLLLAYAGLDATDAFETVGHSTMANRFLKDLCIGHVRLREAAAEQPSNGNVSERGLEFPGGHVSPRKRRTTLANTPHASAGDFIDDYKPEEPLWKVDKRGFLPNGDPVGLDALKGTAFETFADLAEMLPGLAVTGAFRKYLHCNTKLQNILRKCTPAEVQRLDEAQLERAFSAVGFCISAYWKGGTHKYGNGVLNDLNAPTDSALPVMTKVPDFLSLPMLAICGRLGRAPMIDYAATVLYNWERLDPNGPITVENLRCPLRLTGLSDEEWFFKTHVVIESEAAPAVAAMSEMSEECNDNTLLKNLIILEEALWRVVRACMPLMYERAEDGVSRCNEHIFYQIIRPFISTGHIEFEGDPEGKRLLHGPSGAMSSLMPAVDAVLGIEISSPKLKSAMAMFQKSMPQAHSDFVDKLRASASVRSRILFSRPVAGSSEESKEQNDALTRAFNRCISRVLDFRWQHWQYVKNFIMKPGNLSYAVGTGGTSFDYLQQHITDTEHARLTDRTAEGYTQVGTPLGDGDDMLHLPSLLAREHSTRQPLGFWSVDGPQGLLSAEPMLGLEDLELWKESMPPQLHDAVEALLDLTIKIPHLCLTEGLMFSRCENAKDKLAALRQESLIVGLSEVNRERLLTLLCHIAASCSSTTPSNKAPRCIERPLQVAARLAGRSPQLDFVAVVLANWCTKGNSKATEEGTELLYEATACADHDEVENSVCNVCCFIASPDEEWYRSVHIVLHREARDVVAIIRAGQNAAVQQDDRSIVRSLENLSGWMNKFCDYFDTHFEQKDSRTEQVMMRRFSKVMGWSPMFSDEEASCWVYCSGSSVLLPILHAFLGIPMGQVSKIDSPEVERLSRSLQHWIEEMPLHMPIPHRAFLEELQRRGGNLRQYCIKRFGAKAITVELLHDIEVAYNEALNALIRFLSRRMHLVVRFTPHLSSSFGSVHSHLEAAIRKNRLQLLKMRQRADACWEKWEAPEKTWEITDKPEASEKTWKSAINTFQRASSA